MIDVNSVKNKRDKIGKVTIHGEGQGKTGNVPQARGVKVKKEGKMSHEGR